MWAKFARRLPQTPWLSGRNSATPGLREMKRAGSSTALDHLQPLIAQAANVDEADDEADAALPLLEEGRLVDGRLMVSGRPAAAAAARERGRASPAAAQMPRIVSTDFTVAEAATGAVDGKELAVLVSHAGLLVIGFACIVFQFT